MVTEDVPANALAVARSRQSTRKGEVESGTIEQTLPGLGIRVSEPHAVSRALSITPQKRLAVVAGQSHPQLAEQIAAHLGVELRRASS